MLLPRHPVDAYNRLPALVRHLRERRPAGLISAFPFQNLLAIAARAAAGVPTRFVVTERNAATALDRRREKRKRPLPALIHRHYPMADAVVAVSEGLADWSAERFWLPRLRIVTVCRAARAGVHRHPSRRRLRRAARHRARGAPGRYRTRSQAKSLTLACGRGCASRRASLTLRLRWLCQRVSLRP